MITNDALEATMKRNDLALALPLAAIGVLGGAVAHKTTAAGQSVGEASPIYGIQTPAGFRDWRLISVNHLAGSNMNQVRAQVGNDIAVKALREGKLPFPDGSIIAALHWHEASSGENNQVLAVGFPGAGLQSFIAGAAANVQFMVKDSQKYVATGGWGFADFTSGKPGNEALHKSCFACHEPAKNHDYVFTQYAPTP